MTRGSATNAYQADGQGSIRQLTDAGGNVTDSWTYSAFGEVVSRTGTTENAFTYTGEQWDPNAGFYYLRARWYNPTDGRFVSADAWVGDPQAPASLHKYLYANASPITFSDPTGEFSLVEAITTAYVRATLSVTATVSYIGYATLSRVSVFQNQARMMLQSYINALARLQNIPLQLHHFATNKNAFYTPQMQRIADRYALALEETWNTMLLPHLGRHPNTYHQWVFQQMQIAAQRAGADTQRFLQLFDELVIQPVIRNPDMLRKFWWGS
jgi:RHS repeat-associated protein